MDQFVIRQPRPGVSNEKQTYPPEQMMQFQQHPSRSANPLYLSNPYESGFNESPYNNSAGYSNSNSMSMVQNNMNMRPQPMSGIDPAYHTNYSANAACMAGEYRPHNTIVTQQIIGQEYPSHNFVGPERIKLGTCTALTNDMLDRVSAFSPVVPRNKPQVSNTVTTYYREKKHLEQNVQRTSEVQINKKVAESEAEKISDKSNSLTDSKVNKYVDLQKNRLRVFSGPIEKVLKWHKSLQNLGVLVLYEIVAKCVSITPGDKSAKNLVIRDDNGPAMQVVYYEIDFFLPKITLPSTIRVIGRITAGTCRLQAFSVRPATGDDVSILPRRAAVSAHHVAKLCNEFAKP